MIKNIMNIYKTVFDNAAHQFYGFPRNTEVSKI